MPHARNAPPEAKAHAVLALAEYCVRRDVAPDDCSDSDLQFMNQSAEILCKDLNVLRRQAAAQSTDAWRKALDSAHSMRCVVIDRDRKDEQRQRMFRCDGCGRQEKWCGLAIDLAGSVESDMPSDWLDTCAQPVSVRWPSLFRDFHAGYQKDLSEPERADMGRFYLGKTCHRKAQLCFIANTLVQETLYNASQLLLEDSDDELREDKLYTVDDESPQEFIDRKDQLELCVADERRGDMPDVMVDGGFWDNIDEHRAELTEADIRAKAARVLSTGEDEMSDDAEDEFVASDDDGEEEEDELNGVEDSDCEVASRARGKRPSVDRRLPSFGPAIDDGDTIPRHAQPPKKRRAVVVLHDDDDEEEVAAPIVKAAPPVRRSRRVQKLPVAEEVAVADAEPADEEEALVSSPAPESASPPVPRNGLERRSAPPSAIEVARNMRIPREGEQRLGSRQAVLLGLINVQKDLIVKKEAGLAAQVGAAVLTMQELLEIAERSRVGQ